MRQIDCSLCQYYCINKGFNIRLKLISFFETQKMQNLKKIKLVDLLTIDDLN
jgi:hypothetical protein